MEGVRSNAWDISFLVFDPERTAQVNFSHIFLQSDLTYLVAPSSTIRSVATNPGIRIAVPRFRMLPSC